MKKTAILTGLLFAVMSGVFGQVSVAGQTYYYKYVEEVDDSTGVRKKYTSRPNIYITFTKTGCYNSDDKGHEKEHTENDGSNYYFYPWNYKTLYQYQGEKNNLFVFMLHHRTSTRTPLPLPVNEQVYYYFSKDYKRLNMRQYYLERLYSSESAWGDTIFIYERADTPKGPSDGPDVFY
jgi:hypothetical protein